ncbi:MAG: bifunctional 5,10-methylenetetrahydrofolate dehydrogenase/5,10-methenyltetrahydrofolate cyclohydrolase [Candidatus Levybacteria bacterium]|nr:bifunctional 5,10-methylenetetrahydrofolate dehydrogenase/5,10-methenyltetrahydrofolate cyclohydrolase [Candidatus Levybacteria bacterium]
MKIDGKKIAAEILDDLGQEITTLKKREIVPHLHIITLTTDAASEAYVSQKKLKGTEIRAEIIVENLNPKTTTSELLQKIKLLNKDLKVHGIIIQRPIPSQISETEIANSIDPQKDVDGFHPNSDFMPPVALAVLRILEEVYKTQAENFNFTEILKSKKITVVGRGVTAGKPIIRTLQKLGAQPLIVTSRTENKQEILKNSDIIISAVGKPNIIRGENLKNGVILIGVGMFKDENGKFRSDYNEEEIKDIASFYTATPGGVGPINVAMLLSNLVKSAEN